MRPQTQDSPVWPLRTNPGPWFPTFLWLTPHLVSPFTKGYLSPSGSCCWSSREAARRCGPAGRGLPRMRPFPEPPRRRPHANPDKGNSQHGECGLASVFTRRWHRVAPAWVRCQLTTPADCWHSYPAGASQGAQERRCKDGAPAKPIPVPGGPPPAGIQGSDGRPERGWMAAAPSPGRLPCPSLHPENGSGGESAPAKPTEMSCK